MKIVSKAFQLRKQLELKEGRRVPLVEVADRLDIDRKALTRLEAGKTDRFDGEMLAKLCVFYGVGIEGLLDVDPNIRTAVPTHALLSVP